MQETTIYVELVGEGTIVFAPVGAEHLGGSYYRILRSADDAVLRFKTGSRVYCLLSKFSIDEDLVPVAYCELSEP